MPDITQRFIVDAGQSVQTLQQLATGFAQLNSTILNGNKGLNQIGKATTAANKGLSATGKAAQTLGKEGQAGFSRFTVSFQTMVRIVTTQLIVRALADIRSAMSESVSAAIDFQNQIGEISTISTEKDLGRLAAQVRNLSNEFNQDLGDVGAGLYQTISNQIADGAEATKFLAESLQFARITGASTEDTINLLSGTINAFGSTLDDNAANTAKFFETIRLGRTTATELSNSIGRVQTIAAQAGVSLDELLAGFADTTLAGLSTAEASTQIRGALNALLKPTTAMTDALRQLGFANGEQAIQALGLQGAFQALIGTTDGSVTAISELVPRIRGLSFVLRLARDENSKFAESLDAIESKRVSDVADEFDRITDTDAQVVTKFLNELKNTFTAEFGNTVLQAGRGFIEATGGVETFTVAIKASAAVAGVLLGTITNIAAAAQTLGRGLGRVLEFVFDEDDFQIARIVGDEREQLRAQLDAIQEAFKDNQNNINQDLAKSNKTRISLLQQNIARIRKTFFEEVDAAKEANDALVNNRKNALDKIIGLQENFVSDLKKRSDDELQAVTDSQERSIALRDDLEQDLFNSRIEGLRPISQGIELQKRANDLAREAARIFKDQNATDADRDRALDLFDQSRALAEQGREIANQTNNAALQANARRQLTDLVNQQLSAERALQQISKERAEEANKAAQAAARDLNRLKELAVTINDATSRFGEGGELLSDSDRAKNLKEANEALNEFQSLIVKQDDVKIADILGITSIRQDLNRELDALEIDAITISGSAKAALDKQVEDALTDVEVRIQKITGLDQLELSLLVGFPVENENDIVKATEKIADLKKEVDDQITSFKNQAAIVRISNTEIERQAEAISKILENSDEFNQFVGARKKREQLSGPLDELRQIDPNDLSARAEKLQEIAGVLNSLNKEIPLAGGGLRQQFALEDVLTADEFQRAKALIDSLNETASRLPAKLQELNEVRPEPGLFDEYQKLKTFLDNIDSNLQNSQSSFRDTDTQLKATIIDTGQVVGSIANNAQILAEAAQTAAAAAQTAAAARQQASGGFANFGKRISYRAFGGRGLDTRLIMASPGEQIVNSRSSANFASQIQAINAGQSPTFRNEGGPVPSGDTNISIGDINVQGGPTGTQTGREIVAQIRRELRRGTSKLKG